jgi:hypothetical protein
MDVLAVAEAHRTVTAHSRPGYMDLVSEVLDICSDPKAAAGLHGQQQLSLLTEEHQTAYNAVRAVAYAQVRPKPTAAEAYSITLREILFLLQACCWCQGMGYCRAPSHCQLALYVLTAT